MMGNDDLVVATVRLVGRRWTVRVDTTGAHVFSFADACGITDAWGFVADQDRLDDLFRS